MSGMQTISLLNAAWKAALPGLLSFVCAYTLMPSASGSTTHSKQKDELAPILNTLRTGKSAERIAAAQVLPTKLTRANKDKIALALADVLQSGDVDLKLTALKSIGTMGPLADKAVPALTTLLCSDLLSGTTSLWKRNSTYDLPGWTIYALGKIGPASKPALPYISAYLNDKDNYFKRDRILSALGAIGPDSSLTPTIMRIVNEEGRFTESRRRAIRMLGEIQPAATEATPLLTAILKDDNDVEARKEASAALQKIAAAEADTRAEQKASPETAALLSAMEQHVDKELLVDAISGVERAGPAAKSAVPALLSLLPDADPQVRKAITDAFVAIGSAASSAVPQLVNMGLSQSNGDQREYIFYAITKLDPRGKRTIPLLMPFLDDPFKARRAVELLKAIGTQDSVAVVEAAQARWKMH